MEYVHIPKERYDDVIVHLRKTFFIDEPLNKSLGLCVPGQGHIELEKHSLSTLEDGLSIMAVTPDGEIAGVAINGIVKPDYGDVLEKLTQNVQCEALKQIYLLFYQQSLRKNIFKILNIDTILEIFILSVDCQYRGYGIGKTLIELTEKKAKDNNIFVLKTDATGLYSQNVFYKTGFTPYHQQLFSEILNEKNEQIFKVEPPNEHFISFYKYLD